MRWTIKIGGNVRYRPNGTVLPQIATPAFGYKSHISIDRRFGFVCKAAVTSAADSDDRQLRRVIDTTTTPLAMSGSTAPMVAPRMRHC